MNAQDVIDAAYGMLAEHGLADDWTIVIDRRPKGRLGQCRYSVREIGLSLFHVEGDPWDLVRATIAHEIAHVLAGPGTGHYWKWKSKCAVTGADPTRLGTTTVEIHHNNRGVCPTCGKCYPRHKVTQSVRGAWCGDCKKKAPRLTWVKVDRDGNVIKTLYKDPALEAA